MDSLLKNVPRETAAEIIRGLLLTAVNTKDQTQAVAALNDARQALEIRNHEFQIFVTVSPKITPEG